MCVGKEVCLIEVLQSSMAYNAGNIKWDFTFFSDIVQILLFQFCQNMKYT